VRVRCPGACLARWLEFVDAEQAPRTPLDAAGSRSPVSRTADSRSSRARDYNTMLGREAIQNYTMVSFMKRPGLFRWRKPMAGIAFSGHSIVAVNKSGVHRSDKRPLPDGLVESSNATPNIQSMGDLARIAEQAVEAVGAGGGGLAVVLPDHVITTAVYSNRDRMTERALRRELGAGLPYPSHEARYDFWWGRHNEVLGAAVRDVVARQYERIVETVGCRTAWVDGASLCRIPGWAARHSPPGTIRVDVQLYVDHYCLTVFRDDELLDVRTKLRRGHTDDTELVVHEILRAPVLYDARRVDSLGLYGLDAATIGSAVENTPEVGEVRILDGDEDHHLESSIEILLERGSP